VAVGVWALAPAQTIRATRGAGQVGAFLGVVYDI